MDVTVSESGKDRFSVVVKEGRTSSRHLVTVTDEYHQKLTGGDITKEDLVKKSFLFLLNRESKESILSEFDLPVIGRYFPEYESTIR